MKAGLLKKQGNTQMSIYCFSDRETVPNGPWKNIREIYTFTLVFVLVMVLYKQNTDRLKHYIILVIFHGHIFSAAVLISDLDA